MYEKIQQFSRQHLQLCTLVCKIQVQNQRHFTAENPGTSDMWKQEEIAPLIALTKTVYLDQCRFGLVHPEDERPLKKYTRLQTRMVRDLDGRYCKEITHMHPYPDHHDMQHSIPEFLQEPQPRAFCRKRRNLKFRLLVRKICMICFQLMEKIHLQSVHVLS